MLFSFLRFLNPEVFVHEGKLLDKKVKVNFKIYNVATWEMSKYNTHIAQYPKK